MSKLFGKKGRIFVYGSSREPVIKKLNGIGLTTEDMLDELIHIYNTKLQADSEINHLTKVLAGRLRKEEFGLRNGDLTPDKLALFVDNTRVFEWFAAQHSDVAAKIKAGLQERLATPMSDADRVRELEKQLEQQKRQFELDQQKRQKRQFASLQGNQPNEPFAYSSLPTKRVWNAGPGQPSGREESDGNDDTGSEESDGCDDNGRDAVGGALFDSVIDFSMVGNAVEVVPEGGNAVEVVQEGGNTHEEQINREVDARLAARLAECEKETERKVHKQLAELDEKEIKRKLEGRKEKYEAEVAKWKKSMEEAKDEEERKYYEGKLENEKKNFAAYEKKKTEELNGLRIYIRSLMNMGGPSTSAFE
ncbi:hypothetical protein HK104_007667 [Borealophlyctis nickersoniae]|nr:hypothetical protein HK104_007667 [Borealophlyctis nickersoniae]